MVTKSVNVANQAFQFNSTLNETIQNIEKFKKSTAELSQLYNEVMNQQMKSITEDIGNAIFGVDPKPKKLGVEYVSILFSLQEAMDMNPGVLYEYMLLKLKSRLYEVRAVPYGAPSIEKEKLPTHNQVRITVETKVRYVENYQKEQALKLHYATNDIYKIGGPAADWAMG